MVRSSATLTERDFEFTSRWMREAERLQKEAIARMTTDPDFAAKVHEDLGVEGIIPIAKLAQMWAKANVDESSLYGLDETPPNGSQGREEA